MSNRYRSGVGWMRAVFVYLRGASPHPATAASKTLESTNPLFARLTAFLLDTEFKRLAQTFGHIKARYLPDCHDEDHTTLTA
ncbi:hypothetical protein Micbo1qcDRAFT_59094 [Microdochium bolleyi]|uniref:Uncharacterized protein n=1 Tax=Microdochium bolleyi TaxID=196109 RepID=A0A136J4Y4_9PEZI|nr:hypothetical protein Micbo1qcDRAFT_59094 [Microdochium bolleyi]